MRRILMPVLALIASYLMYYFSKLANDSPLVVSPQGCEMSWMSPHYILHTAFNKTWTPLASRYSLWLYRETGVDVANGVRNALPAVVAFTNKSSYTEPRFCLFQATLVRQGRSAR
jgi:GPI inositol-deacylase